MEWKRLGTRRESMIWPWERSALLAEREEWVRELWYDGDVATLRTLMIFHESDLNQRIDEAIHGS